MSVHHYNINNLRLFKWYREIFYIVNRRNIPDIMNIPDDSTISESVSFVNFYSTENFVKIL